MSVPLVIMIWVMGFPFLQRGKVAGLQSYSMSFSDFVECPIVIDKICGAKRGAL